MPSQFIFPAALEAWSIRLFVLARRNASPNQLVCKSRRWSPVDIRMGKIRNGLCPLEWVFLPSYFRLKYVQLDHAKSFKNSQCIFYFGGHLFQWVMRVTPLGTEFFWNSILDGSVWVVLPESPAGGRCILLNWSVRSWHSCLLVLPCQKSDRDG